MGLFSDLGVNVGGGTNWSAIGNGILVVLICFAVVIIVGVFAFIYYQKKLMKVQYKHKIPLFKKLHGKFARIGFDNAKEVIVPDTNVGLYFLKNKKIYIARPTKAMGLDEYWYHISENGEFINFDLSSVPGHDTLSKADYDHRDTRYAYINLKEIIKRNYRDKAVKWWKEYAPLITFIVVSFIFILGCWILLARIGKLINALGPISEQFKQISENMAQAVQTQQDLNSGVM